MRALGIAVVVLGAAYSRSASIVSSVEWNTSALSGLCTYDRLQVQASWTVEAAYEPKEASFIGLVHAATDALIRGSDVKLHAVRTSDNDLKRSPRGLRCEANPVACQPDVTTLVVPNRPDGALKAGDELDLAFTDDTNEPLVATKADLDAILDFPNDFGPAVAGTWVTPRLLRIEILVAPVDDVWIRDIQRSPSVKAFPIKYDAVEVWTYSSAPVTFRVGVAGDYRLVLRLGDHPLLQHTSDVISIDDDAHCETNKVLDSLILDSVLTAHTPSYVIPGILALDGDHSATIPHTSIATSDTGSWSILMWVYLTKRATESHQTLLYKGSGNDDHRTPSMWLNPFDQTLMISVSSRDDMFASVSSASALPLGRWTLLGVTLANHSADSFDVTLTINGRVDASIRVRTSTLLPNAGNLYVGGCPWVRGIQGFVSDVRLYDDAMSETDVGRLFSTEQATYFGRGRPAELGQLIADTLSSTRTGTELVGTSINAFDTDTLLDTGTSYLFGQRYDGVEYIAVAQDTKTATELFTSAMQRGDWRAARFLGLLASTSRPEDALQLYHVAAMVGDYTAMAILAHKYQQSSDTETAAYYYSWAGAEAHREYHRPGQEPLHEMNSLFHADDVDVTLGQAGDDDAWIQFQKMRADVEGDLDAMTAMGDLYYWGARGCVRDHARAFSYFERAADAGHVIAMVGNDENLFSAAGGMLLKGEGVDQNNVTAIAYYEKAAAAHNVRALNGLGYIHFYGSANVAQNQTKGLEYFEAAAQQQSDGDSLFNTGYCYLQGLGADVNTTRALEYLTVAARAFGHFDAVHELGTFYLGVRATGNEHRNLAKAMPYLEATTGAGPWGKSARLGFDLYRRREMQGAIWRYHEAHELGYPVATGNLAYLYGLVGGNHAQYLLQATEVEASLRLGDCYYYGKGGVTKDVRKALAYYVKASADGLSIGAYNAGFLYEHGDDGIAADANRARRYYERTLELSPSPETYLVVYLSLARMSLGLSSWSTSRLLPVTDDDAPPIDAMSFDTVSTALTAAMVVGVTMRFWRRS